MANAPITTWRAVGDGSRRPTVLYPGSSTASLVRPAGYLNATRKLSHGPEHRPHNLYGTLNSSGHGDHQRREDGFVEHIAAILDAAARDGEYDGVIVVPPPKALSQSCETGTKEADQTRNLR